MAKKIIIGNWKMNPLTHSEAAGLYKDIACQAPRHRRVNAVVCPPFIFLQGLLTIKKMGVLFGAQDCAPGNVGPETGGVSVGMLKSLGVSYVIIGHSERRALGENDVLVNLKLKSALVSRLKTVLCVGEKARDESGEYLNFIKNQLVSDLNKIRKSLVHNLIVAYEPVWAIGKDAINGTKTEDVVEVAIFIKKVISEIFGRDIGIRVPVLYGGSVDSKNAGDYIRQEIISGLLVGRASLDPARFLEILNIANEI